MYTSTHFFLSNCNWFCICHFLHRRRRKWSWITTFKVNFSITTCSRQFTSELINGGWWVWVLTNDNVLMQYSCFVLSTHAYRLQPSGTLTVQTRHTVCIGTLHVHVHWISCHSLLVLLFSDNEVAQQILLSQQPQG